MEDKIADYLLDISKLIFAGLVLDTVLRIEDLSVLTTFLIGAYTTITTALTGFIIIIMRNK